MPFFRPLRKSGHLSLSPDISVDSENSDEPPLPQKVTEPTLSLPRPWRKKASPTGTRASSSPPMEPASPKASDFVEREVPTPILLSAVPGVFVTNATMVPPTETIPATNPVPDLLAATWDKVKDGPKGDSNDGMDRGLDVLSTNESFFVGKAGF